MIINSNDLIVSVIDVQEKLINSIFNKTLVIKNIVKIIQICNNLSIPIILSEQYPKGLGKTVLEIRRELKKFKVVDKTTFSCFSEKKYKTEILNYNKKQIIICGIEAHICVFQTVLELKKEGYNVIVVADSVGSRKKSDYELALNYFSNNKINLLSLEMLVFSLLKDSKHKKFKELSKLIK